MKSGPFTWTLYKGKPAVYDTVTRVYYFGYKTMLEAMKKAQALNNGELSHAIRNPRKPVAPTTRQSDH